MAPEIFLPERAMKHHATLELLKKADIWALGLIFYNIVNLSSSAPYVHDLMKANVQAGNCQKHIQEMLRRQELPAPVPEYVPRQATVWRKIFEMFELCAKFDPECRPNASQVMEKLRSGIPKTTCLDTHLKFSQQTAVKNHDALIAGQMQKVVCLSSWLLLLWVVVASLFAVEYRRMVIVCAFGFQQSCIKRYARNCVEQNFDCWHWREGIVHSWLKHEIWHKYRIWCVPLRRKLWTDPLKFLSCISILFSRIFRSWVPVHRETMEPMLARSLPWR